MRVVVVTHSWRNGPLKVFAHWDDAEEWADESDYDDEQLNIASAKVHHQ